MDGVVDLAAAQRATQVGHQGRTGLVASLPILGHAARQDHIHAGRQLRLERNRRWWRIMEVCHGDRHVRVANERHATGQALEGDTGQGVLVGLGVDSLPSTCSGAMYSSVPRVDPARVRPDWLARFLVRPKSVR